MAPLVLPTAGVVSGAAGSTRCASTIAPGYDPTIGETSFGYAVPTVVDATGAADSSACPGVGSGVTSITG